jgi:uncharacterized protein (TIGR02265 family)
MPTDQADLARRVAATTDKDTVRGLIFNCILALIEERLGAEAARSCDPGQKGTRVDLFSYPAADLLRLNWRGADLLEATFGGTDEAFFRFGHRTVAQLAGTLMGRTLMSLVAGSPRKLLGQIQASYRTTVSYGERQVEWLGDRRARVVYRGEFFPPSYNAGLLTAGLEMTGAKNPKVTGTQTGPLELVCEASWDA